MPNRDKRSPDSLNVWITRKEAAEILQTSEKTIDRMAARHEIGRTLRPRPGRKPEPVFSRADLDRLRTDREPITPAIVPAAPAGRPTVPALRRPDREPPQDLAAQIIAALAGQQRTAALYLTLPEAARYLGLPARLIVRLCRGGRLPAVKLPGNVGWRIKRADLDSFTLPPL